MTLEYIWTTDNLRLMGAHYPGKATCVIEIHGMSGNFIENYYANVLGEKLASEGYGFIYAHNRGHSHINELATKPVKPEDNGWNYTRIGMRYELFEDSPKDVAAWVEKAKALGYKKIILLGHSLGCNKTIYYLYQNPEAPVDGVILTSPPDMVGQVEARGYQPDHERLFREAQELVAAGKPKQMLNGKLWNWSEISAQTYLSLFTLGNPADNLPVLHNPEKFEQLAAIKQPILAIMGEYDDIAIRDLREDIEIIKSKATSCQDFQIEFIAGANHNYENREEELSGVVVGWTRKLAQ